MSAKFKTKRGLFWERSGKQKIKFRNILFEVCILPILWPGLQNANLFQELPKMDLDISMGWYVLTFSTLDDIIIIR